jgi:hypothetical protein
MTLEEKQTTGGGCAESTGTATRIKSIAQVMFCNGCCCGRTDRGYPAVPVDRIKAIWKAEKLNRGVQLTISGCLGPCDLANVAVIVTAETTTWLGLIEGDGDYDALIDWARNIRRGEGSTEIPERLATRRFDRFASATAIEPAEAVVK